MDSELEEFISVDETTLDYMVHANDPSQKHPLPARPYGELNEDGEVQRVIDPAAKTFELKNEAPLLTPENDEVRRNFIENQDVGDMPESHHREVMSNDLATDQEMQDGHLRPSEFLDSAQIREYFDDVK